MIKDYYGILELNPDASLEEIRKKYRYLARVFHPDMANNDQQKVFFENKFKEINEAYEVLSNPRQRTEYDARYTFRRKVLEVSPQTLHFGTLFEGEVVSNTFVVNFLGTPDEININPGVSSPWLQVKKIESITPPSLFPLVVEIVANADKLSPGQQYNGLVEVSVNGQKGGVATSFRVKSQPVTPMSLQPFIFRSGETAHSPEELVNLCDKYWDEARSYLYDDRYFRDWFVELRRNDVISSLETCRIETNRDVGLEKFLQSLAPSLELPKISIKAEKNNLGNYDFSSINLPKPLIQITNHGRGCCYGILDVRSGNWLVVPKKDFAIPPRKVLTIPLRVNSNQLIWENKHTSQVEISPTNSQNVKTKKIEFNLLTPRYPKITEIESLRDEGKWRLALEELTSLRNEGEVNKVADQLKSTILKNKLMFITTISIFAVVIYGIIGFILGIVILGQGHGFDSNYWSDNFLSIIGGGLGIGVVGAILGVVGANVYTAIFGGRNGKWTDYILGSLITLGVLLGIALIIGIVVVIAYIVIGLVVLLIFFAILAGLLGGG